MFQYARREGKRPIRPLSYPYYPRLRRQFHPSRPNHFINEGLQLSHSLFEAVHTYSGLSWGLSIPLTAVVTRMMFFPISYITRKSAQQAQFYAPLLPAWRTAYRQLAIVKFPEGTDSAATQAGRYVRELMIDRERYLADKHKLLPTWASFALNLSFLPVYLFNIGAVRRMAGIEKTIFGNDVDAMIVPPEPALWSEGLLWLPNLVEGDPICILPIALGIAQFTHIYNVFHRELQKKGDLVSMRGLGRWRQWSKIKIAEGLLMTSIITPLLIINSGYPAGIVLYLLASVCTQMALGKVTSLWLGMQKAITPALPRRPVLRKEYRG